MKITMLLVMIVAAAGCSMTPAQKKWAGFAAGVLVVGAIAAHEMDDGEDEHPSSHVATPTVNCTSRACF